MLADKIVVGTAVTIAAFTIGMSVGRSAPVQCPDKLQNETLISTTTLSGVTDCTYGSSYGRATTTRRKKP